MTLAITCLVTLTLAAIGSFTASMIVSQRRLRREGQREERISVATNAIGYALHAEPGQPMTFVGAEETSRLRRAAERVVTQLDEYDKGRR